MPSLSCSLKGRQQVIYLKQDRIASCCRAYPVPLEENFTGIQDRWKRESQSLDDGVRLPDCEHCWRDEDQGKISYRNLLNGKVGRRIELVADNLCNHMCSYCSPKFSSMWEDSISALGPMRNVYASDIKNLTLIPARTTDPAKILAQIHDYIRSCDDPITVSVLGGEPLMQIDALSTLLQFDLDEKITLEIITNLNPPSTRFLEKILDLYRDRGKQLRFLISLDATPTFNHVIRHGFDQERFYRCLDLVSQSECNRSIIATISALGILDLPAYLEWLDRHELTADFLPVNNPRSLQVSNVPLVIRQEVLSELHDPMPVFVDQLSMPEASEIDRISCYQYLNQYFQRTGLDPASVDHARFQLFWNDLRS